MVSADDESLQLSSFTENVQTYTELGKEKIERLRNLDLFVLDNSIRETTVGSLRRHTLENKKLIYQEVKKCKFQYFVVEAFNHENRVGEAMLEDLIEKGEDLSYAVAFSEVWDRIVDKVPQNEPVPIGMRKCQQFGVKHVLLEIDLMYYKVDYRKFDMTEVCKMLGNRIRWMKENVAQDSKIFVNI